MTGNKSTDKASNSMSLPKRSECKCECHQPGSQVVHVTPCCKPDDQTKGKDGKDYF